MPDPQGAQKLLDWVLTWFTWLKMRWVDGGYSGSDFAQWVRNIRSKLKIELLKRTESKPGFHVVKKRWIVERTFAWLMRHRRLGRDYEMTESSAEGWIYIAMIRVQLRRLA